MTTAAKDATMSFLNGTFTMQVDVLSAKIAAERIDFRLVIPADVEPDPVNPVQMYVHPDDTDGTGPVRMWRVNELDKAREVGKTLHRVTPDEIEAAKETLLPTGVMAVRVVPADEFESQSRPDGAFYRLRPKGNAAVYAAFVARIALDTDLAYITELTMRGWQKFYRVVSWNGTLCLQEHVRPFEFAPAETYSADYPPELCDKFGEAFRATVESFDPDEYRNFLRDRAAELDAAKADPNAAPIVPAKPKPVVDDTAGLMALLDTVAATASKPKGKTKK